MEEHPIPTVRTARYYTLGPGDAPGAGGPAREVWLACHGYGQLATRFARPFQPVVVPGRLVVVPEGLSRFYVEGDGRQSDRVGASWMTKEAREAEIADQLAFLDAVVTEACAHAGADPLAVPLVAFGFSQGAATVTRWLAQSPLARRRSPRAHRLILWGAALPHDLDLEAERPWLAALDVALVSGDRDPYASPGRVVEQERRMRAAGLTYRVVTFAGEHRLHDRTLAALAAEPLRADG